MSGQRGETSLCLGVANSSSSSSSSLAQSSRSPQRIRRRRRAAAAVVGVGRLAAAAVITMAWLLVLRPARAAAVLGRVGMRHAVAAPAFLHVVGRRPSAAGSGGWASSTMRPAVVAVAAAASDGGGSQAEDEDPAVTRAAMLEEGRRRLAKAAAQKAVMVTARKEKMRRHKRKREAAAKEVSEAERARRRAQEAAAGAVMEWLYEQAAGEEESDAEPLRRLRVAVDLWYDKSDSQYSSLARQLGCAYGFIRKQTAGIAVERAAGGDVELDEAALAAAAVLPPPSHLPIVHLTAARGEVVEALAKNGGDAWRWRRHERPVFEVFPLERLVYLTPDSPNVLEAIDPTKVYVVGGLVDRVVLKGRSLGRAQSHGVATARLPLPEFFKRAPNGQKYLSNLCLAVDRVIEILMRVERSGGDWEAALTETFPQAAKEKRGVRDGDGGGGKE